MPEGEPLSPESCVISGAALRELWCNLDTLPAYTPSPSPSLDPEVGVTTDRSRFGRLVVDDAAIQPSD